jgi:hypothetical protein
MNSNEKRNLESYLVEILKSKKIELAINHCELEMAKIPNTEYHQIIDKNLDHLIDPLILWIDKIFNYVSEEIEIKAMYCELNGFTVNPDRWLIDLFTFDNYQGTEDLDWLADYQVGHGSVALSSLEYDGTIHNGIKLFDSFTITSLEKLQEKFKWKMGVDENGNSNYNKLTTEEESAEGYCKFLIVLRLQELFQKTYRKLNTLEKYRWSKIPIIITAHDWDMIYEINGYA